jgi:hypothetical protein
MSDPERYVSLLVFNAGNCWRCTAGDYEQNSTPVIAAGNTSNNIVAVLTNNTIVAVPANHYEYRKASGDVIPLRRNYWLRKRKILTPPTVPTAVKPRREVLFTRKMRRVRRG